MIHDEKEKKEEKKGTKGEKEGGNRTGETGVDLATAAMDSVMPVLVLGLRSKIRGRAPAPPEELLPVCCAIVYAGEGNKTI